MSYYEDERQRTRSGRERSRYDGYEDDSTYSPRGYNKTTTLVKRRDSYDDVDEEITRDFSPPDGRRGYVRETTIRRSGVRPSRARSFDEERYFDDHYDDGAFGGSRGDRRQRSDIRDRDRRRRYSSDYSSRSRSRTPPRRERRKSRVDETLESLGLGGLVGAVLGKDAKDSSRDRRRSRSRSGRDRAYSESRSGHRGDRDRGTTQEQVIQAVKAAVLAGAGEAFRSRKEPGGFDSDKTKRILTAALTAGGVDGLINSKKDPEHHRLRDTIGSVIAGMATTRIVNGPRPQSRSRGGSPDSRRGRSQSRGGVGDLLAGGAVAAAAKKVYDNVRSRSRGRSASASRHSDVSRSPVRSRSRRRSVSRAAARGLAAVGLTGAADKVDPGRHRERRGSRRRDSEDYDDRPGYYDDYGDDVGQPRSGEVNGRARSVSQSRSDWQVDQPQRSLTTGGYSLDFGARHNGDPDTDSDSDLGSSSGEEKAVKQNRNKWLLTTGLATIATVHAGNEVYQSYEKHRARKEAVAEGKISPEKAKQKQNAERLKEAASVGIAALGLKGAYSEWKEMREHRGEYAKELEKFKRHQHKREARRRKFERLEKQGYTDSGYASSMPNLHNPLPMSEPPGGWDHTQPFADDRMAQSSGPGPYAAAGYIPGAPQYYDDNPYAGYSARAPEQYDGTAFPHPPVGNDHPPPNRTPRERSPSPQRNA